MHPRGNGQAPGFWLERGSALPVGLPPLPGLVGALSLRLVRWGGHWLLRRYGLAWYRLGRLWLLLSWFSPLSFRYHGQAAEQEGGHAR